MIIDFHTHIFPRKFRDDRTALLQRDATFREMYTNANSRMATVERLIERMDEDGVDVSVVMGIGWESFELARVCNDYIVESVTKYPDRLIGFASVNPAWGDKAAFEAERYADAGLLGIGELHPTMQGYDISDHTIMLPLMKVVKSHELIVTTHSSEPVGHDYPGKGTTYPEVLLRFIQNFPDQTIVCAHWGGGLPMHALMPELTPQLTKTYFDTAASPLLYTPNVFPTMVSAAGVDHVLLGSDYPLVRVERLLKQVEAAQLSEADKDAINGGNAARLLGLS